MFYLIKLIESIDYLLEKRKVKLQNLIGNIRNVYGW